MPTVKRGRINKNKVVSKTYRWVQGSQMRGRADLAMAELHKLSQQYRDVKTEYIIQAARNPKNYLHRYFTWNVKEAARICWHTEARKLVRSIECKIVYAGKKPVVIKPMPSIPNKHLRDSIDSYYVKIEDAVHNATEMARLRAKALADLRAWRDRNSMIQGLDPLFKAIDRYLNTP